MSLKINASDDITLNHCKETSEVLCDRNTLGSCIGYIVNGESFKDSIYKIRSYNSFYPSKVVNFRYNDKGLIVTKNIYVIDGLYDDFLEGTNDGYYIKKGNFIAEDESHLITEQYGCKLGFKVEIQEYACLFILNSLGNRQMAFTMTVFDYHYVFEIVIY